MRLWSRRTKVVAVAAITILLAGCVGNRPATPDYAQPPNLKEYVNNMNAEQRAQAWARFEAADRAETDYKMRLYKSGREVSFANGSVSMTWNRQMRVVYINFTQRVVESYGLQNAIMAFQTDAHGNVLRHCGGDGCLTAPLLAHLNSFRTAEGEMVSGVFGLLGSWGYGMGAASISSGGNGTIAIAKSGAISVNDVDVKNQSNIGSSEDCDACILLRRNH